jgi:nucleotide-binding universal stress UspA family protein
MNARPYTIIAAVDASDFTDLVLEHALETAAQRGAADLHILCVREVRHRPRERDHRHDSELESIEMWLRGAVEQALMDLAPLGSGILRIRVHARLGVPAEEILELARECRADLVVMGRHGAGGSRDKRGGSVPAKVLAGAACPVAVLTPIDYGEPAEEEEICPDCVAVRRDTGGEHWFCPAHIEQYGWRSSSVFAGELLRDQGVWF